MHDCSSSNISHYTLMYTESHGKSSLMEVHVASAQLPKSVDLIYINATTTCGETYPIATWKNNGTQIVYFLFSGQIVLPPLVYRVWMLPTKILGGAT